MPDRTLVCRDCNNEFIFTEGEQEFYKEKGFENDPVRCPTCRKARKSQRRPGSGGGGGGGGYGGGQNRNDRSSRW